MRFLTHTVLKKFKNLTYDVTMTSLLKQLENSDLLEIKQMKYHSKGNDKACQKCHFYQNCVTGSKSCDRLSKILVYFSNFAMTSE